MQQPWRGMAHKATGGDDQPPRAPDENFLLHLIWEPWARQTRYFHDRLAFITRPDFSQEDDMQYVLGLAIRSSMAVPSVSWAIPSAEALEVIAQQSGGRVVEGKEPPAEGKEPPAEDKEPPAEGKEPPVEGKEPPVEGKEPPAEGKEPPAEGKEPPVEGKEPPAEGKEPPAEDKELLAEGKEPPAKKEGVHRFFRSMHVCDGPEFLVRHGGCPDRALLLCWARHDMGEASLAAYRGDTVVAVGEVDEGATWELKTWKHPEWRQVRRVPLPNWLGIRDDLRVYRRVAGQKEEEGGE
eukprot:XP_001703052.1 predicted protein [Chlamydomonas reinhardtii]